MPIENETVNFVDVTNDGFVQSPGGNLNHEASEFWSHIEQRVQEINKQNSLEPGEIIDNK